MTVRAVTVEDVLRECAPRVLAVMVRRHRDFQRCEDAVQEALLTASIAWPRNGLPTNPQGWLSTVATRRLIDSVRAERSRRDREQHDAVLTGSPSAELLRGTFTDDTELDTGGDDALGLIVLCCHPALSAVSQIALTLRAVGGLTTAEIAAAFLVPESTMGQRISRAKQTIRDAGANFGLPDSADLDGRLPAVLHVLYLIFTEGHSAHAGASSVRVDLSNEAIRLTRQLHVARRDDHELTGLLALMLLTDARRNARINPDGTLVALDEQDRTRWDRQLIAEGVTLIEAALATGPLGPYQLQAAIAAVHDEATSMGDTDWLQILALYDLLVTVTTDNPIVTLNRAVAVAMVLGPEQALRELDTLGHDRRVANHHLFHAVRGHVLELADHNTEARAAFLQAARHTLAIPERKHYIKRAGHTTNTERS